MSHPAAARHFSRVAARYTRLRDRGAKGALRRQEQRALAELARFAPGERVLDAGCGDGEVLAWVASCGARPFGFDLVQPMAAHCAARGFDVCVQDMEHVGFRPGLDWVLCIGSLEFSREPERAVAELARCLRPEGRFLLLFPRRGWLGAVYRAYHGMHGVPISLFSRDEIATLLRRTGLEPEDWRDCALSTVCRARSISRTDR